MTELPELPFLPYAKQTIEADDIAAVTSVLKCAFLTTGPVIPVFESCLTSTFSVRSAITCNSGTTALYLACLAAGLGPGKVAVVPAITFKATAYAARFTGAEVIYADVNPLTGIAEVSDYLEAIHTCGKTVHVFLPVHLGGQCVDMEALWNYAEDKDVKIIEDATHAMGSSYRTTSGTSKIGSCEHSFACCFSGHPTKAIAMGEGGIVLTNNENAAGYIRSSRNHGTASVPSLNFRSNDIACALGMSQLKKLNRFVKERNQLVKQYNKELDDISYSFMPVRSPLADGKISRHIYSVLVTGFGRDELQKHLKFAKIGTQIHYPPVYDFSKEDDLRLPGAESFAAQTLTLPLFTTMTPADVTRVTDSIKDFYK